MLLYEIKHLINKDIKLELKQSYTLNSILLYAFSTVFISYLSFQGVVDALTWNALFWIILLFASINAVVKSFVQESSSRHLYYFTLFSPQAVIISKIVYNSIMMLVLSGLTLIIYMLWMGNKIVDFPLFLGAMVFGVMGFASLLTMVAAISSRSSNNFGMMAILSFPIIIPFLIVVIRATKFAIDPSLVSSLGWVYVGALALLNVIVIILSFLLFPYLWRD